MVMINRTEKLRVKVIEAPFYRAADCLEIVKLGSGEQETNSSNHSLGTSGRFGEKVPHQSNSMLNISGLSIRNDQS